MAGSTARLPFLNTTSGRHAGPGASAVLCGAPRNPSSLCECDDQADCVRVQWHQNELWPVSCREAGAIERVNAKLQDMNVTVSAQELQVSHFPVDVTLRCALTACGIARAPQPLTMEADPARRVKETYSELVDGQEGAGGQRFTTESLTRTRSRETPHVLRHSAFLAWRRRWTRMLAVSCCRTFTGSLTRSDFAGGTTPDLVTSSGRGEV